MTQGQLFLDFDGEPSPAVPADPDRRGGLFIHRAERADPLVRELGELLGSARSDPFERDVIAVPTKGVERWITQRLSHSLGVSAAIDFPSPGRLIAQCLATVGPEPQQDPWVPERLVFPLMSAIDALVDRPEFLLLRSYVRGRSGRRFAAARLLAEHFADYGTQRPDLLREWARGQTEGVPEDLAWQPLLFNEVRRAISVPFPAERTLEAVRTLREDPSAVELPAVVSVFGPTRLPQDHLDILLALAAHRDVHLWLVHPSPALWQDVLAVPVPAAPVTRREDPTAFTARHALLESWARDCREMELVLALRSGLVGGRAGAGVRVMDVHHDLEPAPREHSRLSRLQAALRRDEPAEPEGYVPGAADDRSIQVHACHGPSRQVEVLRETLLRLLQDDPSLSPRDIVVMCPDVEAYAPLLAAAFGLSDTLQHLDAAGWDVGEDVRLHPGQHLRIRIADRSLHQSNPVLGMLLVLLDLATRRLTVSELLDFAAQPVVRRRFRWSEDDLERVREWAQEAGVRWGLNADHRGLFGVGGVPHNTWTAGVDRVLLGVAMGESGGYVGTGLPLEEVDSTEIDLAGRWAEFVSRVGNVMEASTHTRPLTEWVALLNGAVVQLADVEEADAWMLAHAEQALGRITADVEAIDADDLIPLTAADLRQVLAARFAGRPTRAGFRTGDITVCTLAPMRSVPHRVICLLGMDDGHFPRRSGHDGENLLLRAPLVGERDPGSEDRQLLLDAVMAAADTLVVLYSGADELTGRVRPPAVPIAELLDALGPTPSLEQCGVIIRHPLQPFDERLFTGDKPLSFDVLARDAALARRRPSKRHSERVVVNGIPPLEAHPEVIDLEDLIQFLLSPPKAFLRHRLGLVVRSEEELESEQVPLESAGLAEWGIADRMLRGLLRGLPLETVAAFERRRGQLPPAAIGTQVLSRVSGRVGRLKECVDGFLDLEPRTEAVRVELPVRSGETPMVIQGAASGLRENRVLTVTPSRLAATHRLRSWVTTLVLAAGSGREGWQGVTLGRANVGDSLRLSLLTAPQPDRALELLADLVRLRRLGLDTPLPLPLKTSGRYVEARQYGQDPQRALDEARSMWHDGRIPGEQSSPEFERIWGRLSLDALTHVDVDLGRLFPPGTFAEEAGAFGRLAQSVWQPLLSCEELRAG